MQAECKLDSWLSEVFGYNVFNLTLKTKSCIDKKLLLQSIFEVSKSEPAFFFSKISTLNIADVRTFCDLGFSVVDVSVVFSLAKNIYFDSNYKTSVDVSEASSSDMNQVVAIAENCFSYSRFHLDPLLSDNIANKLKREWTRNYFEGNRGETVLIAKQDKKIIGFLAVLKNERSENSTYHIDLLGVDPQYQGQGVGEALVSFFVKLYLNEGSLLKVGTQIANISSIRLYEKLGFRLSESNYILHGHFS